MSHRRYVGREVVKTDEYGHMVEAIDFYSDGSQVRCRFDPGSESYVQTGTHTACPYCGAPQENKHSFCEWCRQ